MDDLQATDFASDMASHDLTSHDLASHNLTAHDLTAQVQALIQDSPSEDQTSHLIKNVATILALFAQKHLNSSHYYIVRDPSGAWTKNTFIHRTQSMGEKTAIFIFSTPENGTKEINQLQNPQFSLEKIPVIELLFRFWTLNLSDLLILDIHAGSSAVQISRSQLSAVLKQGLKKRSSTAGKGFGTVC